MVNKTTVSSILHIPYTVKKVMLTFFFIVQCTYIVHQSTAGPVCFISCKPAKNNYKEKISFGFA